MSQKNHQLWNNIARNHKDRFDDNWQTYSNDSRIEFACNSFYVDLLFINFSSFKPDTENNANFDAVPSKRANFDEVQFLTHTPKLTIFGTHNKQTLLHNIAVSELLLMQFYLFKFVLNCITGSDYTKIMRHRQQKKHARVIFGMQIYRR